MPHSLGTRHNKSLIVLQQILVVLIDNILRFIDEKRQEVVFAPPPLKLNRHH